MNFMKFKHIELLSADQGVDMYYNVVVFSGELLRCIWFEFFCSYKCIIRGENQDTGCLEWATLFYCGTP